MLPRADKFLLKGSITEIELPAWHLNLARASKQNSWLRAPRTERIDLKIRLYEFVELILTGLRVVNFNRGIEWLLHAQLRWGRQVMKFVGHGLVVFWTSVKCALAGATERMLN